MSSYDAKIIGAGSWGRALAHALLQNKKRSLFSLEVQKMNIVQIIYSKLITLTKYFLTMAQL